MAVKEEVGKEEGAMRKKEMTDWRCLVEQNLDDHGQDNTHFCQKCLSSKLCLVQDALKVLSDDSYDSKHDVHVFIKKEFDN